MLSVAAAFEELRSRLSVQSRDRAAVAARHEHVRNRLRGRIPIGRDFIAGAYSRDTALPPLRSIDLFLVLDYASLANTYLYGSAEANIVDDLANTVGRLFPGATVTPRDRAVNLDFGDLGFDLTPAFIRPGGGFFIPSGPPASVNGLAPSPGPSLRATAEGWLGTDPIRHAELMEAADRRCGGRLRPLVKMLKCWNRTPADRPPKLAPFHLELLAQRIFLSSFGSYPVGIVRFLRAAKELTFASFPDPLRVGPPIDAYLTMERRLQLQHELEAYAQEAERAVELSATGSSAAHELWLELLGSPFPYSEAE